MFSEWSDWNTSVLWNTSCLLKDFYINPLLFFNIFLPIVSLTFLNPSLILHTTPAITPHFSSLLHQDISHPPKKKIKNQNQKQKTYFISISCYHLPPPIYSSIHSSLTYCHCKDSLDEVFNGFYVANPRNASLF